MKKPNHVCRNCGKEYFACKYCDRTANWKSIVCNECGFEGYLSYAEKVESERFANRNFKIIPERTDMTEKEVVDLLHAPIDKVVEETKNELLDYTNDIEELGLSAVIDNINSEIDELKDNKPATKKRTRKTKTN